MTTSQSASPFSRFVAVAVSASVLTMAGCGDAGNGDTATAQVGVAQAADADVPATEPVLFMPDEAVEFGIPTMHCPLGCYPTVERTLAGLPGVEAVQLANPDDADDQKIDDRRVFVTLNNQFNATQAQNALADAGFKPEYAKGIPVSVVKEAADDEATDSTTDEDTDAETDSSEESSSKADDVVEVEAGKR